MKFKVSSTKIAFRARRILYFAVMSLATTILLSAHSVQAQVLGAITNGPLTNAQTVFIQIGVIVLTAVGIIGPILGRIRIRLYQEKGEEINKFSAIAPAYMAPVANLLILLFMAPKFEQLGLISPFVDTPFWRGVALLNIGVIGFEGLKLVLFVILVVDRQIK